MRGLYGEDMNRFYKVIACGSFRRMKDTCGDVDILISRIDGEERKPANLMNDLINHLTANSKLLIEHLQLPHASSYGVETYMGIGRLSPTDRARRVDLKYYPCHLYGYALLYFTGSDYFNRSIRLFAGKKGYSLSDHGLYPVHKIDRLSKIKGTVTLPCYTEEDVFEALGLQYKKPEERSV